MYVRYVFLVLLHILWRGFCLSSFAFYVTMLAHKSDTQLRQHKNGSTIRMKYLTTTFGPITTNNWNDAEASAWPGTLGCSNERVYTSNTGSGHLDRDTERNTWPMTLK